MFGYVLYYASRYCKEKQNIVKAEAFSKVLMSISFIFLGSLSGVMSNLITMVRSVLIYAKEKRKETTSSRRFFTAAYIVVLVVCLLCGVITYKNIFSTFSYVAAVITTTATWFGNPQQIRRWCAIAGMFYLVFQISCGNVAGILFELGTITMSLLSYIKYARTSAVSPN